MNNLLSNDEKGRLRHLASDWRRVGGMTFALGGGRGTNFGANPGTRAAPYCEGSGGGESST